METLIRPYPISIEWPPAALAAQAPVEECMNAVRERLSLAADAVLVVEYAAENENCSGSNHPAQSNVSSPSMPPHSTHSTINVICCADRISRSFAPVLSRTWAWASATA
jgi:hypothetical protein